MGEVSMEEKILAGFGHLMIIFGWYGTAAAIAIWIVKKDKSEFVKKSVKQAVAYQILAMGGLQIIGLWGRHSVGEALLWQRGTFSAQPVSVIWVFTGLALFLYGVIGAVASFKGKEFKYAFIGNFVDKILN